MWTKIRYSWISTKLFFEKLGTILEKVWLSLILKQQDKMKKVVLFLALILALIYCPVNATKRMTSIEPVGEIPFTIGNDGRIYVTAFVNGSESLSVLGRFLRFLRLIIEKVLFLLGLIIEKVYPPSEIRKMSGVI